jgi:hypothetical protein
MSFAPQILKAGWAEAKVRNILRHFPEKPIHKEPQPKLKTRTLRQKTHPTEHKLATSNRSLQINNPALQINENNSYLEPAMDMKNSPGAISSGMPQDIGPHMILQCNDT